MLAQLALAAAALLAPPQVATEDAIAAPLVPASSFGPIALDGDRLVVGSPAASGVQTNSGEARVLERQPDGTWLEVALLAPPGLAALDQFGSGVAVDGDVIAVGAVGDDQGGNNAGAVHVFERQPNGTWLRVAKLVVSDAGDNDTVGSVLALEGERLVAAAPAAGFAPFGRAVFVFERQSGGGWAETAKLVNSDDAPADGFGVSVALDGDRIAVGSPAFTLAGPAFGTGAAYVFELGPGGTWTEVVRLPSTSSSYLDFGRSIALAGDVLVVGSPGEERAECYRRDALGAWNPVQTLTAENPGLDNFAVRLVASGTRLAVGANLDDSAAGNAGSVHLFEQDAAGTYVPVVELGNTQQAPSDFFGNALALDGDRLVASQPATNGPTFAAVYELGSLYHGPGRVSVASGGSQGLFLRAGPERAGHVYALLGSLSGTAPGTVDPSSGLVLPLVLDAYTDLIVTFGGAGVLGPWQGVLDGLGRADAAFTVPAGAAPSLVGTVAHHAYFTVRFTPRFEVTLASNPVRVELVP